MKRYVVVDSYLLNRPDWNFFQGLAALVGEHLKTQPAILVDVTDEALAGMIEYILDTAGVERMELTPSPVELPAALELPAVEITGQVTFEGGPDIDELVDQSIERQAKGGRGKKPRQGKEAGENLVKDAEGKEVTGVDAARERENACEICGKPVSSKKAKLCGSADCKRKWNAQYQREYARKHASAKKTAERSRSARGRGIREDAGGRIGGGGTAGGGRAG